MEKEKPEIRGVMDACDICKDYDKPICYALKTIRDLGHYFRGWCGRDTETGVVYNGRDNIQGHQSGSGET